MKRERYVQKFLNWIKENTNSNEENEKDKKLNDEFWLLEKKKS